MRCTKGEGNKHHLHSDSFASKADACDYHSVSPLYYSVLHLVCDSLRLLLLDFTSVFIFFTPFFDRTAAQASTSRGSRNSACCSYVFFLH